MAFAVALEDVGVIELVRRGLDHLALGGGRAVVDHEHHGARRAGADGDERLEDRLDLFRALRADGYDDEGWDGFHVFTIGFPQRDLERREIKRNERAPKGTLIALLSGAGKERPG